MLFTIKIIAAAIAGTLGVLGVVFDYREKESKRLTGIGRAAVALIIIALFIAIGAELLERREDLAEKEESDRRHSEDVKMRLDENTRLLNGIYQTSVPLGIVEATLSFDVEYEKFPSYDKRLSAAVKKWKPDDPRFKGFDNTNLIAPGVPQPIKMMLGIPGFGPVASDEVKLANSLKPKPNTATIRVQRDKRQLQGILHFRPSYEVIPEMTRKRLVIRYAIPQVEWSNPTSQDVSLFDLRDTTVKVTLDFHPPGILNTLLLRVPTSNHRLVATDLKQETETPRTFAGTLKEPPP